MMGRGYDGAWGVGTIEVLFTLLAGLFMLFVLAGLALIVVYIIKSSSRGHVSGGYGPGSPQPYPERPYVGHRGPERPFVGLRGPVAPAPGHPMGSETMQHRRMDEARATVEPAYDIARQRYASGEITREEYQEIVRTLADRTGA